MKITNIFKFMAFALTVGLFSCTGNSVKQEKTEPAKQGTKIVDANGIIALNKPDTTRGTSMMEALKTRKSVREFADKELTLEDLSDLLWAANGVNRPSDGKRTAASALNAQDIDIFVCLKGGTYLYDAVNSKLVLVTAGDLRPTAAGKQTFVNNAPACLVLVSDISRFPGEEEEHKQLTGAMDAGIVSANISLFCSSAGLATVPRASMDTDTLRKALNLKDSQIPLMNHPVGYHK